LQRARLIVEI